MRPKAVLFAVTVFALSSGCSSGIQVRTAVAPDASFADLRSFRVLAPPSRRPNAPALSASDPMLDNSITNRQLRDELASDLENRGYLLDTNSPDFVVAYYAGTKEKMDTTYWNPDPLWRYGFRGYRSWAWPYYGFATPPVMQVREYTEGSVIIDVIDTKTKELVWRGQGVARVSDNPSSYAKEISKTVDAILKKFPKAST